MDPRGSAAAFVLLNAVDCYLTLHILGEGGRELNPVMAALIAFSIPLFVVGKLSLGFFSAIAIAYARPKLMHVLAFAMALPVVWNLYQMARHL